MVVEEHEDQREHHHAKDFEHHAGVVDESDDPDAEDAEQGRAQEHEGGDVPLGVEVGWDVATEHVVDQGDQDQGYGRDDGGHGQDTGEQIDPAGEPCIRPIREVLGPLVHGPRDREVRADLGEVQPDDQLADHDDGPAPEERWTGEADTEDEQSEDAR